MNTLPKKITKIYDVARMAGCSNSTVSFVLTNKWQEMRITEAMANKVKNAAILLDYESNQMSSLRLSSKVKILLFIEWLLENKQVMQLKNPETILSLYHEHLTNSNG